MLNQIVRYANSSNRVQVTQILQLEEGTDERNAICIQETATINQKV